MDFYFFGPGQRTLLIFKAVTKLQNCRNLKAYSCKYCKAHTNQSSGVDQDADCRLIEGIDWHSTICSQWWSKILPKCNQHFLTNNKGFCTIIQESKRTHAIWSSLELKREVQTQLGLYRNRPVIMSYDTHKLLEMVNACLKSRKASKLLSLK